MLSWPGRSNIVFKRIFSNIDLNPLAPVFLKIAFLAISLIASSLIFGIIHGQNPEIQKFGGVVFIFYIGSGLFAGIMTLMDEGIELALGWHAANNMTIALLVTADWTALQTHSILKDISNPDSLPLSEVLIPVLVFFPLDYCRLIF